MAIIRPFRGLRYSADAGALENLVAPPYDVLSPAERDEYAVRSPHNVVHLTLPEQQADDRSKFVKYARSAALLAEWRRSNVLVPEERPAFYRYDQTFTVPRMPDTFRRTSVIALIKVEPYEKGVVLPHEQTFPKHKEDRLRILEATRSHLECIFGLYEDPSGQILNTVTSAPAGGAVHVRSDEGVEHVLEPITDEGACNALAEQLQDRKVWIADGHHRYETAVNFRSALGERDGIVPEDFMMMALSSMSDPGLVLLPTHRILSQLPVERDEALRRLDPHFTLHETHQSRLMDLIELEAKGGRTAFGLALPGESFVLTAKQPKALQELAGEEGSDALRALDVTVLHRVILENLLGVKGLDSIRYTRDASEATGAVNQGAAAAFLMNPPSVEDMRVIANGGEKMPQKSTYYFPKILSGLVLWSLNDF